MNRPRRPARRPDMDFLIKELKRMNDAAAEEAEAAKPEAPAAEVPAAPR